MDGKVLAKRHHHLNQWNNWLMHADGGRFLLQEEISRATKLLSTPYFKSVVLIGVPNQQPFLQEVGGLHQVVLSALPQNGAKAYIEVDYQELPIFSGEVDLVIMPHTLEWVENPRQLLHEACRIVKREGLIIIFGFNPRSLFKVIQLWKKKTGIPWAADFLPMQELKNWLELAGFQIEKLYSFLYRPLGQSYFFDNYRICNWIGENIFPYYGGIYTLLARAKEIPLTPIRMQWKQHLSGARISSAISSNTMHNHDGLQ